jgi:hypothetical protein
VRYYQSFIDTSVSPEQQEELQKLKQREAEHASLIAEFNYGMKQKYDDLYELIFRDRLLAEQRKANHWQQQYKEVEARWLKELGGAELRRRQPEAVEQLLIHETRQAVWEKHKKMEAKYRDNHAFMNACSAAALKSHKHDVRLTFHGKLGDQFLRHTSYAIIRDYHLTRPDFNPPEEVEFTEEQMWNADSYTWNVLGEDDRDTMDLYIDELEVKAEKDRKETLDKALRGTLNKLTRPLFKAAKQKRQQAEKDKT